MSILDSLGRALLSPKVTLRRSDITVAGTADEVIPPLVQQLKQLRPVETRRETTDRYFEGVVTKARLAEFSEVLEAALGPPAKPFGARADFEDDLEELIDSQGGIEKEQCLYLRAYEGDGSVVFAALWPWSNGTSITLKVGAY